MKFRFQVLQEASEMVKPKLNEFERKLKEQNQKLEKQLRNQNLTNKLLAFTSIINGLEKQLESLNRTLENQKLYGMEFLIFLSCFTIMTLQV